MVNSDIMRYKSKIAGMLCNNKDIIEALNVKEHEEEIMYNHIFPYIYVDYPVEETKNFICFSLDIPRIDKRNEYFKHAELTVYAICHRNEMKTSYGGTRADVLEGLIIDMFNWNIDIGFELALTSSMEKIINDKYHARVLKFNTLKFNSLNCGIKNGSTR